MPLNVLLEFVLLAALWGASFLFTRLTVTEFGVLPTAFMRVAIAALVLLPLVLARGQLVQLRRHWKPIFAIGLLNSGLPFAFYAFAVTAINTGLAAILNATTPMFGALVAWLWLKDKPNGMRLLGLAIGFAGVALLAGDKASFKPDAAGVVPGWAVLASLAACLCYGLAASASKRHLTGIAPLVTATGSQIGATLALALPAVWTAPTRMPSLDSWLAMLALGVLCTGVAYVLFFRIIEKAGPSRALAVPFLVPVFAVVYGAAFLHEAITPWMLLCGAVIVLGTALSTGLLRPWRTKKGSAPIA
jgi:drug/metabolite transporter (DMT)-like permease